MSIFYTSSNFKTVFYTPNHGVSFEIVMLLHQKDAIISIVNYYFEKYTN